MPVHHCNKNNGQNYMQHFYQAADTISQGVTVLAMFMNSTFSLNKNVDCSSKRIIINKFNPKNFLHYCIQAKKMQCTIRLQTYHTGIQYLCIHNNTRNAKQKKYCRCQTTSQTYSILNMTNFVSKCQDIFKTEVVQS